MTLEPLWLFSGHDIAIFLSASDTQVGRASRKQQVSFDLPGDEVGSHQTSPTPGPDGVPVWRCRHLVTSLEVDGSCQPRKRRINHMLWHISVLTHLIYCRVASQVYVCETSAAFSICDISPIRRFPSCADLWSRPGLCLGAASLDDESVRDLC